MKYAVLRVFPIFFAAICMLCWPSFCAAAESGTGSVKGRVHDMNGHVVFQAAVELRPSDESQKTQTVLTDQNGEFLFEAVVGTYSITVSAPDFQASKKNDIVVGTEGCFIDVTLSEVLRESIEVRGDDDRGGIRPEKVELSTSLPQRLIDLLPATGSKKSIENVLAGQPGIIKTPNGIYVYGNRPDEVNYRLNGFNIAHPLTYTLPGNIGVETVDRIGLLSGRYLAEHGGAGGSVLIETKPGSEMFKINVTNALPGISLVETKGLLLDNWSPKINFSGPLGKNFLFFNGLTLDYLKHTVLEMPKGQDSTYSWGGSNFFSVQGMLTPRHVFSAGMLGSLFYTPRSGLGPLDPLETTKAIRERQLFFYAKDAFVPVSWAVMEFGYGHYSVYHREQPQGNAMLNYYHYGRRGNAVLNQRLNVSRDEFIVSALFTRKKTDQSWLTKDHKIKLGIDVQFYAFDETSRRSGYRHFRVDGTRAYEVRYGGNNLVSATNRELGVYVQDVWTMTPWLAAGLGLRYDRSALVGDGALTPRGNISFVPPQLKERTKFTIGVARVPESASIYMLTRPLGQYMIGTSFLADGVTRTWEPLVSMYRIDRDLIHMPTITNFSFGVEQQLPGNWRLNVNFLRKWGNKGFVYDYGVKPDTPPPPDAPPDSTTLLFLLGNGKSHSYRSVEVSLAKNFSVGGLKGEWSGSYTRSKARSNAALDIGIDTPIRWGSTEGVLSWDAPNRAVMWGLIDLPKLKDARLGAFIDWRDGLPYTVRNDEGMQIGEFNSWRLPKYFSANLRFEKGLSLFSRRWLLRLGVENLTNRDNPQLINENISSPYFGQYHGKMKRKYDVGMRLVF